MFLIQKKFLLFFLLGAVLAYAGPNQNARIVFDYDLKAGNQGVTAIDAPGAGETIVVEVRVIGCNTLDSYSFQIRYFVPHIIYGELSLKNGVKENNILNQKGPYLLEAPIVTVDSTKSVGVVTVSVVNTTDDPNNCPSGDGLLAKVTFYTKVDAPMSLQFGQVIWKDPTGVTDICPDDKKGEFFMGGGSLPVELSLFTARQDGNSVLLRWVTETENNSYGFHVWRSSASAGEYQLITAEMIRAAGNSTTRREYQWRDTRVEAGQTYYYKLQQIDISGASRFYGPVNVTLSPEIAKPHHFRLYQNFPNPFNPSTTIKYELPAGGIVRLEIFDLSGKRVRILVNEFKDAGSYTTVWDGKDDKGNEVSAGTYFAKIKNEFKALSCKMILLR